MMMNAEAISHELVAAGLPAKAAEVIAKNLANGSEYHVSAADFADFKTVTRDDIKQINAKLDKIREEVFAQKEHTTATSTNLQGEITAASTSLREEIAATKTGLQQEIAATKTGLQQEIAELRALVLANHAELKGELKSLSSWVKGLTGIVAALAAGMISAAALVILKGGGL